MNKILVLMMFQVLPIIVIANNNIPNQLFGVTLGTKYKEDNLNILNVKKLTGCEYSLGYGLHCYFKPIDEASSLAFPYIENKKSPKNEAYKTSFRLYLLPVIPNNLKIDSIDITTKESLEKSIDELDKEITNEGYEILSISWSEFPEERNKDEIRKDYYYWAVDLCKIFEERLYTKPKISDYYDHKNYVCKFVFNEKEFVITAMGFKEVKLKYADKVLDKKNKALEAILRKVQAKIILP